MKIVFAHVHNRPYFVQWIMTWLAFLRIIIIGAQWKFDRSIWNLFLDKYFPKKSNFITLQAAQYFDEFPLSLFPSPINVRRISPPLIFFHLRICANFFIRLWSTEMNKCQGSINNNICLHHFHKSTPFQKGLCCNVHKITSHNYHKTMKHYSHKPISFPPQTNQ